MDVKIKVDNTGPLFTARAGNQLRDLLEGSIRELVQEGETFLNNTLKPRPSGVYLSFEQAQPGQASTGNYRRNLSTQINSLNAVISDGGVVYGPWLEGVSSRNATTRFKGYSAFRRAGFHIQKKSKRIAEKYVKRFVRKMNK